MKKILFAAVLAAGTTLGFAKEAKQQETLPIDQTINSLVKNDNEKIVITKVSMVGHLQHVEGYVTTTDSEGYVQVYYYDFYIYVP
ncbi:hypothetical protein [uncultured Chryseobacterium sp.]|uniref:hypothetical protein n=1 Tax=uncultured Chryseobacterium sp. TaxID=259322 RepID=UPI0025EC3C35|nr:hypothetical protein [uncultured Chryseobacterium sp.]